MSRSLSSIRPRIRCSALVPSCYTSTHAAGGSSQTRQAIRSARSGVDEAGLHCPQQREQVTSGVLVEASPPASPSWLPLYRTPWSCEQRCRACRRATGRRRTRRGPVPGAVGTGGVAAGRGVVARGVDVTLFAALDSVTKSTLDGFCARPCNQDSDVDGRCARRCTPVTAWSEVRSSSSCTTTSTGCRWRCRASVAARCSPPSAVRRSGSYPRPCGPLGACVHIGR